MSSSKRSRRGNTVYWFGVNVTALGEGYRA